VPVGAGRFALVPGRTDRASVSGHGQDRRALRNVTLASESVEFDTNPKGGSAFYILAHQYMAAVLNQLNGASSVPGLAQTMADAYTLLDYCDTQEEFAGFTTVTSMPSTGFVWPIGLVPLQQ
jgi:hypothetical protein